jgi:hypothetical protein
MPTNKDFKRLVRRRVAKTGESYTAARAQLLRSKPTQSRAIPQDGAQRAIPPARYATVAGMSDASVRRATGCGWERWVKALDRVDAHTWPHRRIAEYVSEKYKLPSWWRQMVTVGYERIKGLRARGQRRDGAYRATRSKVVPVPIKRLYRAFADARTRARWLPGVALKIRRATKDKSMRLTWPDATSVEIGFTAKTAAKSQVQIQHSKLGDQSDSARRKAFWTERLEVLAEVLDAPMLARAANKGRGEGGGTSRRA